jgi:hypothetical protein
MKADKGQEAGKTQHPAQKSAKKPNNAAVKVDIGQEAGNRPAQKSSKKKTISKKPLPAPTLASVSASASPEESMKSPVKETEPEDLSNDPEKKPSPMKRKARLAAKRIKQKSGDTPKKEDTVRQPSEDSSSQEVLRDKETSDFACNRHGKTATDGHDPSTQEGGLTATVEQARPDTSAAANEPAQTTAGKAQKAYAFPW